MFDLIFGAATSFVSSLVDDFLGFLGADSWLNTLVSGIDVSAAVSDVITGAAISAATGHDWLDGALAGGLSSFAGAVGGNLGLSAEWTNAVRGGILGSGSTGWSLEGALGGGVAGYMGGFGDSSIRPGGMDVGQAYVPGANAGTSTGQWQPEGAAPGTASAASAPGTASAAGGTVRNDLGLINEGANTNPFGLTSQQGLTQAPQIGGGSNAGLLNAAGNAPGGSWLDRLTSNPTLTYGAIAGLGTGLSGQAQADASRQNNQDNIQAAREARQEAYQQQIATEERAAAARRGLIMGITPNTFARRATR